MLLCVLWISKYLLQDEIATGRILSNFRLSIPVYIQKMLNQAK